MRIGIFSECYHPVLNGVVVSIDTFKKELEKRGHEFVIVTTNVPGSQEEDRNVLRVPSILPFKPKGGRYPIASPQSVGKWTKKLSSYNLDLIHSQHLLSLGALGLKVAKKLNIPAVLTYHTLLTEYVHYVPVVGSLAKHWIVGKSRKYANQYQAVVTPSPAMKELLVAYGVKTPITPIPTGIELDQFENQYSKAEVYQKFGLPKNQTNLLLYVSRIGKEKNVYFLFNMMKKLTQKRQDTHLLMVGGGDELEDAKNYVKKAKLDSFITFAGAQEKPETNKIYGGADIFVFASVTETQGIIVQEAQASGLPVVVVDKMGPGDYVKNGEDGFLTPLNVIAFTDQIEYLLEHQDVREKMSEQTKIDIKNFSAEKCAEEMERLYEQTINNYRSQ